MVELNWAPVHAAREGLEKELHVNEDRLGRAKLKAIEDLFANPRVCLAGGDVSALNLIVYEKKIDQIRDAQTTQDLKEILAEPKVRDNGIRVMPVNKWVLPEEEMIVWANTSLKAPLTHRASVRYQELFRQLYPEQAEELGI